ncbi:hypothetical protein V8E55_007360 [Tylopilus felleus]
MTFDRSCHLARITGVKVGANGELRIFCQWPAPPMLFGSMQREDRCQFLGICFDNPQWDIHQKPAMMSSNGTEGARVGSKRGLIASSTAAAKHYDRDTLQRRPLRRRNDFLGDLSEVGNESLKDAHTAGVGELLYPKPTAFSIQRAAWTAWMSKWVNFQCIPDPGSLADLSWRITFSVQDNGDNEIPRHAVPEAGSGIGARQRGREEQEFAKRSRSSNEWVAVGSQMGHKVIQRGGTTFWWLSGKSSSDSLCSNWGICHDFPTVVLVEDGRMSTTRASLHKSIASGLEVPTHLLSI